MIGPNDYRLRCVFPDSFTSGLSSEALEAIMRGKQQHKWTFVSFSSTWKRFGKLSYVLPRPSLPSRTARTLDDAQHTRKTQPAPQNVNRTPFFFEHGGSDCCSNAVSLKCGNNLISAIWKIIAFHHRTQPASITSFLELFSPRMRRACPNNDINNHRRRWQRQREIGFVRDLWRHVSWTFGGR